MWVVDIELVAEWLAEVRAYRLRELREAAGLTQAQLAERIGVGQRQVSKIENGAISPSLGSIRALARALQVPVTSLFREFDEVTDATFVRAGAKAMHQAVR